MLNEDYHDTDRIDKYIAGTLKTSELTVFEKELKSNPELQHKVDSLKNTIQSIKDYEIKNRLKIIHGEFQQKKKKATLLKWLSGIAATIVVSMGLWFAFATENLLNTELVEQNFRAYPNLLSARNDVKNQLQWNLAMQYYSKGNFVKCLDILKSERFPDELRIDLSFYMTICLIATGKYDQARESLITLSKQDTKYQQQIVWYLSLCQIASNQNNNALKNLKSISSEQYAYKEALKLIQQIEKSQGYK